MKWEWKKQEKALYGAKKEPALIDMPAQNFIMIKGNGNPNDTDFSDRVSALYSLAYAIKMHYKSIVAKNMMPNEIHDFTVYPLEGIWALSKTDKESSMSGLIKENLEYTIMIRQPDFITAQITHTALEKTKAKKPNPLFEEISFGPVHDGKCVEILHIGSYDSEPSSFQAMDTFTARNALQRISDCHREIYLSNANRTKTDKLKTILRYQVQ